MNPDDVLDELNEPAAQDLLQSAPLARLAYLGPDDLPRVVPIGFHWTGHALVMCTATIAPKVRSLRQRPEVAMAVDDEGPPARSLSVRGSAAIDVVEGVPEEFLLASAKGIPEEQFGAFEIGVRSMYPEMARITVKPTWARTYDFGAGRVPGFLMTLSEQAAL